jgi:hypothetical protein
MWAVDEMRRRGIEPNEKVHRRVEMSMRYAVGKAMRRGIKEIPEALMQYAQFAA